MRGKITLPVLVTGFGLLAAGAPAHADPPRIHGRVEVHLGGHPAGHLVRGWVPGHYETRVERQVVPGHRRKVWVPPVYREVCTPGRYHRTCTRHVVAPGHYRYEWVPTRVTLVEKKVWIPGHYRVVRVHPGVRPGIRIGGFIRL